MAIYLSKYNQTIFDIAVQMYGNIEGVYFILRDNENIDLNTELKTNTEVIISDEEVVDNVVYGYFRDTKYIIVNGETSVDSDKKAEESFWASPEDEFVVNENQDKIIVP